MLRARIATASLALAALAAAVVAAGPLAQEMPKPTGEHQLVLSGVGEWEGTLTSSFVPGAPPETVPATETIEGIGPFWTQSRFECTFMGMPYVGTGCMGYDATKKKFVGTWIDNMSSTLAVMEGEMGPDGKTLVMRWTAPDMTGQMVPHRNETVHAGDSYTSTFYMGEGEGMQVMVITMKRKAQAAGTTR